MNYRGDTEPGMFEVNYTSAGDFAYKVQYGGGTQDIPATGVPFPSQALCEAPNAGVHLDFTHNGGSIGMFVSDTDYSNNTPGSPNPTFKLQRLS